MLWAVAALFFILSVVLISGRGAFLIAGYNTAGRERKSLYDEKKLCRITGGCLGVVTVLLAVQAAAGENAPSWMGRIFVILVAADVIVTMVLANTVCRIKNPSQEQKLSPEEAAKQKARDRKAFRGSMVFTVTLFVIVGIFLTTGNVKVSVENGMVNIRGSYWTDDQVALKDIRSVVCREDFHVGSRVGGLGSFRLLEGNFRNEEFGNYTLYAYTKCGSYVVLETAGRMIVVNGQTPEETRALAELIEESR